MKVLQKLIFFSCVRRPFIPHNPPSKANKIKFSSHAIHITLSYSNKHVNRTNINWIEFHSNRKGLHVPTSLRIRPFRRFVSATARYIDVRLSERNWEQNVSTKDVNWLSSFNLCVFRICTEMENPLRSTAVRVRNGPIVQSVENVLFTSRFPSLRPSIIVIK